MNLKNCGLAWLVLLGFAAPVDGFIREYLPLRAEELALRFPVKPDAKFDGSLLAVGTKRRVGSASLQMMEDGILRISGNDKAGLSWSFETASHFEGSVYSGDLDGDGQLDLIYSCRTGGNGWSPTADLAVLLFDDKGGRFHGMWMGISRHPEVELRTCWT